MKRVDFLFTRTGQVIMTGAVALDLEDPDNEDEVKNALEKFNFAQFLATDVTWVTEEWNFEPKPAA